MSPTWPRGKPEARSFSIQPLWRSGEFSSPVTRLPLAGPASPSPAARPRSDGRTGVGEGVGYANPPVTSRSACPDRRNRAGTERGGSCASSRLDCDGRLFPPASSPAPHPPQVLPLGSSSPQTSLPPSFGETGGLPLPKQSPPPSPAGRFPSAARLVLSSIRRGKPTGKPLIRAARCSGGRGAR